VRTTPVTEASGNATAGSRSADIEFRRITKSFDEGGAPVLDNIELVVEPGSFV
jgi:ABC-type multidrug transport system fused ATPase/permease subunit